MEDEIFGKYNTIGVKKIYTGFWGGSRKVVGHFEDLENKEI
jgi:hypothetical protein